MYTYLPPYLGDDVLDGVDVRAVPHQTRRHHDTTLHPTQTRTRAISMKMD